MSNLRKFRAGGWLLHDRGYIDTWVRDLKARVAAAPRQPLIEPIMEFKDMVNQDPALNLAISAMFMEAALLKQQTPLGTPEVENFDEFLMLLNHIMTQAPEYTVCPTHDDPENPCGLIGFPINALLDWPMATATGYYVFANSLINQQFKKIFAYWSKFLVGATSTDVLTEKSYPDRKPPVLGWLHPDARQHMVDVACCQNPKLKDTPCQKQPFEHFFKCNPGAPHYGYTSWDSFFTREFNDGIRPVASPNDDNVIANACESGPLQVHHDVCETNTFWAKGQPYSLQNMMNFDPLALQFVGGTVYQAFLSALSYHRWHSPVSGTIEKAYVVDGTYYLENRYQGFISGDPDSSAPNDPLWTRSSTAIQRLENAFLPGVNTMSNLRKQTARQAIGKLKISHVSRCHFYKHVQRLTFTVVTSILFISSGYAQSPLPDKAWLLPPMWKDTTDAKVQQSYYYEFMWRSFVALNWPNVPIKVKHAKIDSGFRGKPIETKDLILKQTGSGPLPYIGVWEWYREPASEIYLPPNTWHNYPDWNTPRPQPPRTQSAGERYLRGYYNGFLEYATDLNQPDFFPFPTGPLIDQNGNYVRYEVAVNQAFFTYIKHFKYYNPNQQIRAVQRYLQDPKAKDSFQRPPHGTQEEFKGYLTGLPGFARQGMVDVKAAWRVLDTTKGDQPKRYLHRTIQTHEGPKLMGLVALHILRFTPNHRPHHKVYGQVAATFEQVDNVSGDAEQGIKPSFNNGDSSSSMQRRLGFEGAIPAAIPKGATPPPNPKPVSIYRVTTLSDSVDSVNVRWQAKLDGSVFQYYKLIGTQNKHPGIPPQIAFGDSAQRAKNGHQGPITGVYTNTSNLINTALESYTQKNHSCIQCHVRARPVGVPTQAREVDHFKILTFLNQAASAHFPSALKTTEFLRQGEYIVSPNGKYFAIMQVDGNFCVYKGKGPEDRYHPKGVWCSGQTASGGEFYAIMQQDGNFCVYKGTGPNDNRGYVWCSGKTASGGEFYATVTDDGKFSVFKEIPPGSPIWGSP